MSDLMSLVFADDGVSSAFKAALGHASSLTQMSKQFDIEVTCDGSTETHRYEAITAGRAFESFADDVLHERFDFGALDSLTITIKRPLIGQAAIKALREQRK